VNDVPHSASPREQTRSRVLSLIRRDGEATRAELAEATGLPRSTVGHAVRKLIEAGLVVQGEQAGKGPGSGSGRPGLVLRPAGPDGHVAAIDFGHERFIVALADESANEVDRIVHPAPSTAAEMIARALEALSDLQFRHDVDRLAYVAAAVPRPIVRQTGQIRVLGTHDSWQEHHPGLELASRLGVPVHIENDAMAAAYGERRSGAARGDDDVLYVKVSSGVGASLLVNGRPYYGAAGLAGDIGHTKVPGRTDLCPRCGGRGCLEAAISVDAIRTQLAQTHPGIGLADVFRNPDVVTERVLDEAGRVLGGILSYLCSMLNPALVVLGGEVGRAPAAFRAGVTWGMQEAARTTIAAATRVVSGELGEDAEITGLIHLACDLAAGTLHAPAAV